MIFQGVRPVNRFYFIFILLHVLFIMPVNGNLQCWLKVSKVQGELTFMVSWVGSSLTTHLVSLLKINKFSQWGEIIVHCLSSVPEVSTNKCQHLQTGRIKADHSTSIKRMSLDSGNSSNKLICIGSKGNYHTALAGFCFTCL